MTNVYQLVVNIVNRQHDYPDKKLAGEKLKKSETQTGKKERPRGP